MKKVKVEDLSQICPGLVGWRHTREIQTTISERIVFLFPAVDVPEKDLALIPIAIIGEGEESTRIQWLYSTDYLKAENWLEITDESTIEDGWFEEIKKKLQPNLPEVFEQLKTETQVRIRNTLYFLTGKLGEKRFS